MDRGNDGLWNAVSIFFLVATVVVIIIFLVMGFSAGQVSEAAVPTVRVLPTSTNTPIPPTVTPTLTLTATNTPTPTATGLPSLTPRPTETDTLTPFPSATITATTTVTPTLDVTLTFTPIPSATGPSPTAPPALPFAGPDNVQFTRNFANTQGCAWEGIGGQILALGGGSYTNTLQVHVFNATQDFAPVFTGTNSAYGASGFEVRIANAITRDTYFVQLQTRNGVPISEQVTVSFPGDCEQNVAIVNFQQVRSLNP
ncbi:MAG: hypothetical protein Q9P44_03910 [Anaerolineae bacterium]|nr:hypothetical protein [Anaerolineae bacterium]